MKRKSKGYIFIIILILGTLGLLFAKFFPQWKEKRDSLISSDSNSSAKTIVWAGDGYAGYSLIRSHEMKKRLARKGIVLKFVDDGGAYETRLEKFDKGEYQFIAIPISTYKRVGFKHHFPGKIVGGICESVGADAIMAFPDFQFNKVNDLDDPDLKFVLTDNSPSEDLFNLTAVDFDLENLINGNCAVVRLGGSKEVYSLAKKAQKDKSLGNLFLLWEPEVSQAQEKLGMKKVWSSEKFRNYIVDVFVFSQKSILRDEKEVNTILKTYYEVVEYYNSHDEERFKMIKIDAGTSKSETESLIKNIRLYTLHDNALQLFGINTANNAGLNIDEGIVNSIYAWNNVHHSVGIDAEVEDPYSIINSSFIEGLIRSGGAVVGSTTGKNITFDALKDKAWGNMTEAGNLRVQDIPFQAGTSELQFQAEEIINEVAMLITNNYPGYRILIQGHTASGDKQANLKLSQERADVVRQHLIAIHGIDSNRLHAKGYADEKPPRLKPGESTSSRSYRARMMRVEFVLVQ